MTDPPKLDYATPKWRLRPSRWWVLLPYFLLIFGLLLLELLIAAFDFLLRH